MKRKIGFGMIGCGAISRFHMNAIKEISDAYTIGVYDPNVEAMESLAKEYNVRSFETQEELLLCPEIDVVCVLTPSGTHSVIATAALKSGKHVVIEKPMALTLEDADALIELSEQTGKKVCVISQLRFAPAVQAIKNAIEMGLFGKIVSFSLSMKYFREEDYYTNSGWRGTRKMDGGGAFMNQGIHGIDILQYFAGPVQSLRSICDTFSRPIETEDHGVAIVKFKNKAVGTIEGSTTCYPGYPRRLEICGDQGSVFLEEEKIVKWNFRNREPAEELLERYQIPLPKNEKEEEQMTGSSNPMNISLQGHILQLSNVVNAITKDEPLLVDAREGRKSLEIILGIYKSSEEKAEIFF